MAKISYLIATKNRARTLKETIDSLQKQTVNDWEAVIIDDHSTDETENLISKYKDDRLRYFLLPSHMHGPANARNFGALMSASPILAILDSDDAAYPKRTEVTLKSFRENPTADIFYGNIDVLVEETGIIRDRKTPFIPFSYERLKQGNFITHSTVAIKRQLLLDFPYNPIYQIAEDYELYTRLAAAGKIFVFTNQKIVLYRVGADNLSVGDSRSAITNAYSDLVRMARGWISDDPSIYEGIRMIEEKE